MRLPHSPIEFDSKRSEYHVRFPQTGETYRLKYCPTCGGRLQPSLRAESSSDIDGNEAKEATEILASTRSVSDVINVLGQPTRVLLAGKEEAALGVAWQRALHFSGAFSSFEVVVLENPDGSVNIVYVPLRAEGTEVDRGTNGN